MKKLNILISFDIPDKYMEKIQDISKDIKLKKCSDESELLMLIEEADVLFAGKFSREMLLKAKKLKWIQCTGVGIDRFYYHELLTSEVIITNAGGIFSTAISEHIIMFMLFLTRRMDLFIENKSKKKWNRYGGYSSELLEELAGKTLGIIGIGNTGKELAKKAKCLGMNVLGVKKNLITKPSYLDELFLLQDLDQFLTKSDFIVLTLPLTEETKGLIGEHQLLSMKKTAYLINVSRGKIIDEDKLLSALEQGKIAGAAIDTFNEEPLPINSKFWELENVIITPHMAGVSKLFNERITNLFCENLLLFIQKKPMLNIVNKKDGY